MFAVSKQTLLTEKTESQDSLFVRFGGFFLSQNPNRFTSHHARRVRRGRVSWGLVARIQTLHFLENPKPRFRLQLGPCSVFTPWLMPGESMTVGFQRHVHSLPNRTNSANDSPSCKGLTHVDTELLKNMDLLRTRNNSKRICCRSDRFSEEQHLFLNPPWQHHGQFQ